MSPVNKKAAAAVNDVYTAILAISTATVLATAGMVIFVCINHYGAEAIFKIIGPR